MGMHLTQVTPRSSMRDHEPISAHSYGVRDQLCDRRSVSNVPRATPVAGWFSVRTLWIGKGMAGTISVGVRWVWVSDFGYCRNNLPGHPDPTTNMVSRHVVGDYPKEWSERIGAATSIGAEGIQNRLDDDA